jgi:hypothetical protein
MTISNFVHLQANGDGFGADQYSFFGDLDATGGLEGALEVCNNFKGLRRVY